MRRAPGWTRLAGIALELSALAFVAYVLTGENDTPKAQPQRRAPRQVEPEVQPQPQPAPSVSQPSTPRDFIEDDDDEGARYYRAADDATELIAGFYSDGRVRLTDKYNRRFAGMLQGTHADLLELESNQWGELSVLHTPAGGMQLELRGGPYDARVLTCEPVQDIRFSATSG